MGWVVQVGWNVLCNRCCEQASLQSRPQWAGADRNVSPAPGLRSETEYCYSTALVDDTGDGTNSKIGHKHRQSSAGNEFLYCSGFHALHSLRAGGTVNGGTVW
jgi:hypothetical protein